jgi:predicted CoA-binding protein
MLSLKEAAQDFLSAQCIAVAGVSRTKKDAANAIYTRLREDGYRVFAINPKAEKVEGDVCYTNLKAVPEQIEGLVIVTKPEMTEELVRQCPEAGVKKVWMHKSIGNSVSEKAVAYCRENGIRVIDGACPMMFCQPVDFGHKCLRFFLGTFGQLPRKI